jgi:hypothetical protein
MLVVTVVMFGIHFAEVLYVSLKVQEAANSAQWQTTASKLHDLPGGFGYTVTAVASSAADATARYRDFDGRTSHDGPTTFTQALTRSSGISVGCTVQRALTFPVLPPRLTGVYSDPGNVSCDGQARIEAIRMPVQFLAAADGFFKERHVRRTEYQICAYGAAFSGGCAGLPAMMLDDWGLSGAAESRECTLLEGCGNTAYKSSVRQVYEAGGAGKGGAAAALAAAAVGTVPIDPNHFWFSFRGEESEFLECTPLGDGPNQWETSPGLNSPVAEYDIAYRSRGGCMFGRGCGGEREESPGNSDRR